MKPWRRRLIGTAITALAILLSLAGTAAALLNLPDALFAYHVQDQRLDLWSDQPFDAAAGRHLLADVERRISASGFDDQARHGVVIANRPWDGRFTFLWNAGAAGLNWYPLTRNVFIRSGDIASDRVTGRSGRVAAPPRTLAYYAAHEIGHTLIAERTGLLAYRRLPRWMREGLADYIGLGGRVNIDALLAQMRANDPSLDPARSGNYARYRLLVAMLIERKDWTVERLLDSRLSQDQAESIAFGKGD